MVTITVTMVTTPCNNGNYYYNGYYHCNQCNYCYDGYYLCNHCLVTIHAQGDQEGAKNIAHYLYL